MSSSRLARIEPAMRKYIDEGSLPGLTTLVARRGKLVHFKTYGFKNIESREPMTEDTIFRIYSMSKPITSAALMILYEEGKLLLTDPVSKYIPEFKHLKAFAGGTAREPVLEDPRRPVTVLDLARHTGGFTYTWGSTPVDALYRDKDVLDAEDTLQDMIEKLSKIPLLHQPGTQFHYSVGTDILGYVIEVVSGMPLDQFLKERIFDPLGMVDTGFYVPEEKIHRLATRYELKDGELTVDDPPRTSIYRRPSPGPLGGSGLVSTNHDYFKFAQMILNKGELNGKRILGRQTVEFMLQNQLPEGVTLGPGTGFGIGFGVVGDPAQVEILSSPGEASWSGAANTFFWIDSTEEMIFMVWTQLFPWGAYEFRHQFRVLVHASVIE